MSRKEVSFKTNAARILDRTGVVYELRTYTISEISEDDLSAARVAEAIGMPAEQVFKTLVACGDRTGVLLACIPGSAELDLKALAAVSGNKKIELAALKNVLGLTGYIRGGVSPLGTKKPLPVFMDETAMLWNVVAVSAGIRGCQMLLAPADLARVALAKLCDIARFSSIYRAWTRHAISWEGMLFRKLLLLCPWALLIAQTPAPQLPPPPKPTAPVPPPAVTTTDKTAALPSVPPDKVIISVGDTKITSAEFNQIIDSLPAQYQATARGAGRKQTADNLVRILVLSQEGKRRKLDETPAFKIQSMFQNANLLANRTFETINQEANVSDEEMRKHYEAHKAEYDQVRGSHILIRMQGSPVPAKPGQKDLTEAEALAKVQEIRKKLVAGEDFATLATKESDDTQSAAKGGSLGVFRRNQMVPAFDEVAFKLAPGELSEPVKTQFGYHLIKVESKEKWTFEEAKPELERRLKPEAAMKTMQDLEKKGNVVLDPEFFSLPKQ